MKEFDPIYNEMKDFREELESEKLDWIACLSWVYGYELLGEFLAWYDYQKREQKAA